MAIIVIAINLDALLNVLKIDMRLLIYPSTIFLVAVALPIGLGFSFGVSNLAENDLLL